MVYFLFERVRRINRHLRVLSGPLLPLFCLERTNEGVCCRGPPSGDKIGG